VVAFNLVLEAGSGNVNDVSVTFNSLTGPDGATIMSKSVTGDGVFDWTDRHIELFYTKYLQIKGLSDASYNYDIDERHIPERMRRPWSGEGVPDAGTTWADRPGADKYYPDILVPIELEPDFDITSGNNQSVWTDIYIPKDSPAGIYTGTVSISEGGEITREIPVSLTVRDFSLPDVPSITTLVNLSDSNLGSRFLGHKYAQSSSEEAVLTNVRNKIFQLTHRHKIPIISATGASRHAPPNDFWIPVLDGSLFTSVNNYDGPGVSTGQKIFSIGTYGAWQSTWDSDDMTSVQIHADEWSSWFSSNYPDVEYYLYLADEISDYAQLEQWSQWIDNSPGQGSDMLTLSTMRIQLAQDQCPALDIPSTVSNIRSPSDEWETEATYYRDTPGKRLQFYNGWRPTAPSFATEDDGIALRALAWVQYKLDINHLENY